MKKDETNTEIEIVIPKIVKSNYNGYDTLLNLFDCVVNRKSETVDCFTIGFHCNDWFDSNLLPIIYAYIVYGKSKFDYIFQYRYNGDTSVHQLMIRNGFAQKCFNIPCSPKEAETIVPFKVFNSTDTYNFGKYIDSEIVRYLPSMENTVKRDISAYIQELFGNAQIHGRCRHVFTCGQYYPKKGKMDFTVVNLGRTFHHNVTEFFERKKEAAPDHSVAWAVLPEHSTKLNVSGGLGLSLMRDFVHFNNGRFQIVSGNEYWELNTKNEIHKWFECEFPGTIVNIEIDQHDKNHYKYVTKDISEDIF